MQYAHWRPLGDRILIRHVQIARPSPIITIEDDGPFASATFDPVASMLARVIAVGEGRVTTKGVRVPPSVAVGDIILIEKRIAYRAIWSDARPGGKFGV